MSVADEMELMEYLNTPMTPSDYFNEVKSKKKKMTNEELKEVAQNCLELLEKYRKTGQTEACKKVLFFLETLEKEHALLELGVDTYVFKEDIEEYIDNISSDVVKIIELENYEREIPDEIVDTIEKTRKLFDSFFVVFTDYTGKEEKKIEEKRKEKDPILFGAFENTSMRIVMDRFYFLGDWVDEYCDLTLEKMVGEMKRKTGKNIEQKITIPQNLDEIREEIKRIEKDREGRFLRAREVRIKKKSFFDKVRSVLKRNK